METLCNQLVDTPGLEEAVRVGDVFAQLVELSFNKGNMQACYEYIDRMIKKKIVITPYLDPEMVERAYTAMGLPPPGSRNDGIDEDIREDF